MTFSQYLKMLFPYLGCRTREDTHPDDETQKPKKPASKGTQADFVVYIVSAFIEDDSDDCCKIINSQAPDRWKSLISAHSGHIFVSISLS